MVDPPVSLAEAFKGTYALESQLGQGGMATVYLAQDLKHDRKVAIKVLKPELAAVIGAERFLAEIKTTANLQHPHILPLFDSGEADGFLYYVMPFVEGESLRAKLDREKQLPVDEAVSLAADVASALHYAHEREVIHRDIKPANILLHAGQPVVADFGIALAVSTASEGRMTETGLSLGTPHYMSPEQATADRDLTPRSDVYALGCVLYEMLAGQPPHTGPSAQSVLVRILTEEPRELTDVRQSVPSHVAAAVTRAIEKLPADRFESAQAMVDALGDPHFRYERVPRTGAQSAARKPGAAVSGGPWLADFRSKLAVGVMGLMAVVSAALMMNVPGVADSSGAFEGPMTRTPFDSALGIHEATSLDVSPDGTMIAYNRGDEDGIWLVRLDGSVEERLPGTEGGRGAVFSPDGSEIAFTKEGENLRISIDGGSSIPINDEFQGGVSQWTDDGWIYSIGLNGFFRAKEGGELETLSTESFFTSRQYHVLPGDRRAVYTKMAIRGDESEIHTLDFVTGQSHLVIPGGFDARYLPSGHLVYGRFDQSVVAIPFDIETGTTTGAAFPVLDSVLYGRAWGRMPLAFSAAGTAVYIDGEVSAAAAPTRSTFVFVDSVGVIEPLPITGGGRAPAVSPDGAHVVFIRGQQNLVVYEFLTGREISLPIGFGLSANWSRSGDTISFVTLGRGDDALLTTSLWDWRSGADPEALDLGHPVTAIHSWGADGRALAAYQEGLVDDNIDLGIFDPAEGSLTPYLEATWEENGGRISTNGQWVVYLSNESGTKELYLRSFPDPGARVTISGGRGGTSDRNPRWSPDGSAVYYLVGESLWVAELDFAAAPRVTDRREVFGPDLDDGRLGWSDFDIHPDGRFIVRRAPPEVEAEDVEEAAEPRAPRAYLITNWLAEVARRGGGG